MPSKKEFKDLLEQLDINDGFLFYEDFDILTEIIKGTELIEFLPDLLHKLKDSSVFDYEDNNEFRYGCFKDLVEIAKESNLMSEYFSEFSSTVNGFMLDECVSGWKFPNISPFYDLFDAIKGTELVRSKFLDLLNMADNLPPGYEGTNYYEAFSNLIDEIKGTEVMRGNLSDLLKGLDKKYDAFYALINTIKGTELMKEKIMDVLDLLDEIIDYREEDKYDAFAELFNTLKGTDLLNEYYILLEKRFSTLLNGLKNKYNFDILINTIEGTDLMNKFFPDLLDIIDGFSDGDSCRAFSKLVSKIQGTKLFLKECHLIELKFTYFLNKLEKISTNSKSKITSELLSNLIETVGSDLVNKNFSYILDTIDEFPNDSYKSSAIKNLIEKNWPDLINNKFFDLLEAIDKLSGEDKKKNFFRLVNQIDVKDFIEKLPILKERFPIYTLYAEKIENSYREWQLL